MKNVCFFNSTNFWGGGEKLHFEYAYEFHKKGYNVTIATRKNSPLYKKAQAAGIALEPVKISDFSFLNPVTTKKLVNFYQKEKIDTVVFSTSEDVKAGAVAAKKARVTRIVYLRGLAVPIKNSSINRRLFQKVLTHIVPNSLETKRMITKHLGNAFSHHKMRVIYHGIEVDERVNSSEKLPVILEKGHGVILGNAGRLTLQKGQQHLIEVALQLQKRGVDFTLFIAGKGELEEELKQSIATNNLQDHVILLGFVSEMEQFMNSIDVFLLSSIWEGFGYVLVEAMSKSKPIVAFNTSSNPEIVQNNVTGFLVEYPDVRAFTAKTQELINDPELRLNMGNSGKERVNKHFKIADRIDEFEAFLLEDPLVKTDE